MTWKAIQNDADTLIVDSDGNVVADIVGGELATRRARARVMAAGEDLLAAGKAVRKRMQAWIDRVKDSEWKVADQEAVEALIAAITKAEKGE